MNLDEVVATLRINTSQMTAGYEKMKADSKAFTASAREDMKALSGSISSDMRNYINQQKAHFESSVTQMRKAVTETEAAARMLESRIQKAMSTGKEADATAAFEKAGRAAIVSGNAVDSFTAKIAAATSAMAGLKAMASAGANNGFTPAGGLAYDAQRTAGLLRARANNLTSQPMAYENSYQYGRTGGSYSYSPSTAMTPYVPAEIIPNMSGYYPQNAARARLTSHQDIISSLMAGDATFGSSGEINSYKQGLDLRIKAGSLTEAQKMLKMNQQFIDMSGGNMGWWGNATQNIKSKYIRDPAWGMSPLSSTGPFVSPPAIPPGGPYDNYQGGWSGGFSREMWAQGADPSLSNHIAYWKQRNQLGEHGFGPTSTTPWARSWGTTGNTRDTFGDINSRGTESFAKTNRADPKSLDRDAKAAIAQVKEMEGHIGRVRGAFTSMGNAGTSAIESIGRRAQGLLSSLNPLAGISGLLHSRWLKIMAVMGTIGAVGAMAHHGINSAMDYQDNVTAMGVMMGSPSGGKSLVDQIQAFSASTPFHQGILMQSARTLQGYGVEGSNIMPALKAISQVTAGAGGGDERFQRIALAFGQVQSKGTLKGEEVRQFANAGVGLKDFADAIDVTTPKLMQMMRRGQVEGDILYKTFNKLTQEGGKFGGVLEKQMANFHGRIGFIENQFGLGLQSAGTKFLEGIEKAGVFDIIEGWVAKFRMVTDEMGTWDEIGKGFRDIFVGLETAATSLWEIFKDIGSEITGWDKDQVLTPFQTIGGLIALIPEALKAAVMHMRALGLEARAMMLEMSSSVFGLSQEKRNQVIGLNFQAAQLHANADVGMKLAAQGYVQNLMKPKDPFTTPEQKAWIVKQKGLLSSIGAMTDMSNNPISRKVEEFYEKLNQHQAGQEFSGFGFGSVNEGRKMLQNLTDAYGPNAEKNFLRREYLNMRGMEMKFNYPGMNDFEGNAAAARDPKGYQDYIESIRNIRMHPVHEIMPDGTLRKMTAEEIRAGSKDKAGFDRLNPPIPKGLDLETYGAGINGIFTALSHHFKDQLIERQPEAHYAGSQAAQDAVNAASINQDENKLDKITQLLELWQKEQQQNEKENKEWAAAMLEKVGKDPVIQAAPVKGR